MRDSPQKGAGMRTGKSSVLNNTESGINLHDIRVTTTLTKCNYNITPILR